MDTEDIRQTSVANAAGITKGAVPKLPINADSMSGANPATAKPNCVPIAMPERRTRVGKRSAYVAGQTALVILYTTPPRTMPVVRISALLPVVSDHRKNQTPIAHRMLP